MENGDGRKPSLYYFYRREIHQGCILFFILVLFLIYQFASPVRKAIDFVASPTVQGLSLAYGKASTLLHRWTLIDLGFVGASSDPDFLFRVQLATYINERRAAPLLDIAANKQASLQRREAALLALHKFDSSIEWIEPFLNELPKGGLLELHEEETPLLDSLMKMVRSEGGIQKSLVKAYAELVFEFMLQVPDAIVKRHALRWISDVLPEEALFLILPRIPWESDPVIQAALVEALWDIRAVSDPEAAGRLVMPLYQNPPWPELTPPLAAILSRLGFPRPRPYLEKLSESPDLSEEQRVRVRVALDAVPYPRWLKKSPEAEELALRRKRSREQQYQAAWQKQIKIKKEERMEQVILARATAAAAKGPVVVERFPPKGAAASAAKTVPFVKEITPAPAVKAVQEPVVKVVRAPSKKAPAAAPAETSPPPPPSPPGPEPEEAAKEQTLAMLPEPAEMGPPPPIEEAPKPSSNMRSVDMIFEVKNKEVSLYQNPGPDAPSGVFLPVGTKGKANLVYQLGEDSWYQLASKKGGGWANGKSLKLFDLSPEVASAKTGAPPAKAPAAPGLEGERRESTYFEVNTPNVAIYEKPSLESKKLEALIEGQAYLATRSEKVGPDRWFLLEVRPGVFGWAEGIYLQLADVPQPALMVKPTQPLSLRQQKSAFAAEWVVAGVKDVSVYERPSIASEMLKSISPPDVFEVVEAKEGGGSEWYKIKLPKGNVGWVKVMDVNLTKPSSQQ
ncbi:MAG: SH3 domain-containing protein [Elusimicrobia bacterium]|nr:SH3 domain-containing protein [Candidatus Obscuribacterium magneticum]